MDFDLFVGNAHYVGGCPPEHVRGGDVGLGLGANILLAGDEVLAPHVTIVVYIVGDLAKSVGVQVFGFDGMNVAGVSCISKLVPGTWEVPSFFSRGTVLSYTFLGMWLNKIGGTLCSREQCS